MVTSIFQGLSDKAEAHGINDKDTAVARTWYRNEAAKVLKVNDKELFDRKNVRTSLQVNNIGQMFMFGYMPKHKDTLSFYDRFPLVFPIDLYDDGFLGINLHYLPQKLRAKLMDALYLTINNKKYDLTTRLKINYEILKNSSKMRFFKPCLKRYLRGHVMQKFLYIDSDNWDKALFLPTERFAKKSKAYVHNQTTKELGVL